MEGRELAILRELAVLRGDDPAGVRIGPVTRMSTTDTGG